MVIHLIQFCLIFQVKSFFSQHFKCFSYFKQFLCFCLIRFSLLNNILVLNSYWTIAFFYVFFVNGRVWHKKRISLFICIKFIYINICFTRKSSIILKWRIYCNIHSKTEKQQSLFINWKHQLQIEWGLAAYVHVQSRPLV